jgi:hypothetical protein
MAKQNEMRTRRASDSQIDRYLFICLYFWMCDACFKSIL